MKPAAHPEYFTRWRPLFDRWQGWLEERGLTPLRACVGCPLSYAEIDRAIVGVDSLEHLQAVVADAAQPLVAPPVSLTSEETALLNPSRWNVT